MKKKILIVFILLALVILGLIIPNNKFMNFFNKQEDVKYIDSCFVYLLNDDEELVGITVSLTEEVIDEFTTVWNLLTVDVPKGYHSPIYFSTQVINCEIKDDEMLLNVSEDLLIETSRKTLECLVYNFCVNDVKKINLQVNSEKINELDGIHFDYLTKNIGVNLTFEEMDVLNSKDLTMVYEYTDYVKPVTYFVNEDTEVITYLVMKSLLMSEEVNVADVADKVSYDIVDNILNVNVTSYESFNEQVLNTIASTFKENFTFNQILVNGLELDISK